MGTRATTPLRRLRLKACGVAVLLAVFGSGVELETWAVFVIQPLPLPVTDVVSVNDAFPP